MNKYFIASFVTLFLAGAANAATPQNKKATNVLKPTFTEWHDLNVNQINRFPCHTSYFAFESEAAARGDKKASTNYISLNGKWKFNWVEMPTSVLPTSLLPAMTTQNGAICLCPVYGNLTDMATPNM